MSIDKTTLDKIAGLAHLKIDDTDKAQYLDSFNKILKSMEALSAIDTDSTQPFAYELKSGPVVRIDNAENVSEQQQIESNAPEMNHNYFLVPKVIEG